LNATENQIRITYLSDEMSLSGWDFKIKVLLKMSESKIDIFELLSLQNII